MLSAAASSSQQTLNFYSDRYARIVRKDLLRNVSADSARSLHYYISYVSQLTHLDRARFSSALSSSTTAFLIKSFERDFDSSEIDLEAKYAKGVNCIEYAIQIGLEHARQRDLSEDEKFIYAVMCDSINCLAESLSDQHQIAFWRMRLRAAKTAADKEHVFDDWSKVKDEAPRIRKQLLLYQKLMLRLIEPIARPDKKPTKEHASAKHS
jgi:hypothetical protein